MVRINDILREAKNVDIALYLQAYDAHLRRLPEVPKLASSPVGHPTST
ncbi:MAG TPA: hypothetical protein PLX89_27640 [Verrucomicrobiota bacterium]|nr:hypothetical protein [Verrucomicrobiota bacterium]